MHVGFDDLVALGVPESGRLALRGLLAELPLVPNATHSAQLVGPPESALACLAVLARHVGQGLRDTNLTLAHDRDQLRSKRAKLIFVSAASLPATLADDDERLKHETVLFISDLDANRLAALGDLFARRDASGVATFVTAPVRLAALPTWRLVDLTD